MPIVATARTDVEGVKRKLLEGLKGVDEGRLRVLGVDVTGMLCHLHLSHALLPMPIGSPNSYFLIPDSKSIYLDGK